MSLASIDTTAIDKDAILRVLKLNPTDPKTQALLLICDRYHLDPLLKHMVLIDGNPYVTRDGYLHVAHMSGMLDGIEVVDEGENDDHWWAKVSVYRKDMSRAFTFKGRYPRAGTNKKYGPEMAIKVAEVASLRRAFDVTGIGAADEQWDAQMVAVDPETGELLANHGQVVELWRQAETMTEDQKEAIAVWRDAEGIDTREGHLTLGQFESIVTRINEVKAEIVDAPEQAEPEPEESEPVSAGEDQGETPTPEPEPVPESPTDDAPVAPVDDAPVPAEVPEVVAADQVPLPLAEPGSYPEALRLAWMMPVEAVARLEKSELVAWCDLMGIPAAGSNADRAQRIMDAKPFVDKT